MCREKCYTYICYVYELFRAMSQNVSNFELTCMHFSDDKCCWHLLLRNACILKSIVIIKLDVACPILLYHFDKTYIN